MEEKTYYAASKNLEKVKNIMITSKNRSIYVVTESELRGITRTILQKERILERSLTNQSSQHDMVSLLSKERLMSSSTDY